MNDIHALIQTFLQQQSVASLVSGQANPEDYTKSGVIPFMNTRDGLWYYVMKPVGNIPELGEPPFQLCKGTRQYFSGLGWHDMRDGAGQGAKKETLAQTALREGIEELGLKLENVARLMDMGGYGFSSATTGKSKQMWLFAAEIKDGGGFLPDADIADTTHARKWLKAAEFAIVGREDHRYIVQDIETRLTAFLKE